MGGRGSKKITTIKRITKREQAQQGAEFKPIKHTLSPKEAKPSEQK